MDNPMLGLWSPANPIARVLQRIQQMIHEDCEYPINPEALTMYREDRAGYDKKQADLIRQNPERLNRLLVAAQQRLAFAAAFALHDGFLLAPRAFTLAAVPTLAARPGDDGRLCHPLRAMVLDAAPRHLAGAYMASLAVMRRACAQGTGPQLLAGPKMPAFLADFDPHRKTGLIARISQTVGRYGNGDHCGSQQADVALEFKISEEHVQATVLYCTARARFSLRLAREGLTSRGFYMCKRRF